MFPITGEPENRKWRGGAFGEDAPIFGEGGGGLEVRRDAGG